MRSIRGNRAAEIEGQIDPALAAAGVAAKILAGKVTPAGPQPLIIRQEELAMIAQVSRPPGTQVKQCMKDRHLAAGGAQPFERRMPRKPQAGAVDHQTHSDASARPRCEPLDQLTAECVICHKERAHIEAPGRAFESLPEGRTRLHAI
jgi:hypothetical protein